MAIADRWALVSALARAGPPFLPPIDPRIAAAWLRSSSSVGFGLSILLIFIYWMVWHYTCQMAIQWAMAPAAGSFLADVLGIAGAIALLRRSAK